MPGAVVADLKVEGVVQLALVGLGQLGQVGAGDRQQFQQFGSARLGCGVAGGLVVERCEAFAGGSAVGADGGEAVLEADAPFGIGEVVAGGFEGFDLGEQVLLGSAELVELGPQLSPFLIGRVRWRGGRGLGKEGVAAGSEDALGEEGAEDGKDQVLADCQGRGVVVEPGLLAVLLPVDVAGVVGVLVAS